MSYEPTLVIRKRDLEKKRNKIEEGCYSKKEEESHAYRELKIALEMGTVKFPEIELVIIRPELTSHNSRVRNLLTELRIDYRVDN